MYQSALEITGIDARIAHIRSLGSGDVSIAEITLETGEKLIAKSAGGNSEHAISVEYAGLSALARPGLLRVPRVYEPVRTDQGFVLLMQCIEQNQHLTDGAWIEFGRSLAEHHVASAGERFGFDHDNFIGRTHQPNDWMDDWVEFNRVHRLGYQHALAQENGLLPSRESDLVLCVIDQLDKYIPRRPIAALLHGDLWSGNAIAGTTTGVEGIFVIDPAVYHGDPWADIAMMHQFGGFPEACFRAHADAIKDHDRAHSRIRVYQLYHMLNHLNLFGGSYLSSVSVLCGSLLAE